MQSRGFTLIEVMITVAIVGILAAVALPSYREQVDKSRRAEARGQLLETAQFMQRFYSQNDRFDQTRAGVAVAVPANLARVPREASSAQNYAIGFAGTPTISTFTLQAVPQGAMAADKCGGLVYDNTGRRSITAVVTSAVTVDVCWK